MNRNPAARRSNHWAGGARGPGSGPPPALDRRRSPNIDRHPTVRAESRRYWADYYSRAGDLARLHPRAVPGPGHGAARRPPGASGRCSTSAGVDRQGLDRDAARATADRPGRSRPGPAAPPTQPPGPEALRGPGPVRRVHPPGSATGPQGAGAARLPGPPRRRLRGDRPGAQPDGDRHPRWRDSRRRSGSTPTWVPPGRRGRLRSPGCRSSAGSTPRREAGPGLPRMPGTPRRTSGAREGPGRTPLRRDGVPAGPPGGLLGIQRRFRLPDSTSGSATR